MSILIKGMEMPTERESYTITVKYNGLVFDAETGIQVAEAHEIPPHGRLIDADALAKIVLNWITTQEKAYQNEDSNALSWRLGARAMGHQIYRDIEAAPTIIPAEEGET